MHQANSDVDQLFRDGGRFSGAWLRPNGGGIRAEEPSDLNPFRRSHPVKTIADYTSPGLMVPCLHSQDAAAVVGELCGILRREGRLKDLLPFFNAAMNAEYLESTATFPGWALPQARVKDVSEVSFALGRSGPPLEWLGRSGQLVRLVFLFTVPETDPTTYLALGSALARLGMDPVLLEALLLAPDGQAMFDILKRVPLRQPHGAASGVPIAARRRFTPPRAGRRPAV